MNTDLIFKKAVNLHLSKKLSEAEELYKKILKINPNNLVASNNLASIYNYKKNHEKAKNLLEYVLKIKPSDTDALNNYGNALKGLNRFEEALLYYKKSLELKPDFIDAINNMGNCLTSIGRLDEAIKSFKKALSINSNHINSNWNLSLLQLLVGDFEEGWKNYEWRKKRKATKNKYIQNLNKEWDGRASLKNKKIYIYKEQGLGDYIQFSRYLLSIKKLGAHIILDTPNSLKKLIKSLEIKFEFIDELKDQSFDFYCSIMSLPFAFKTNFETIPNKTPYFFVEKNKEILWKQKIKNDTKKIGLCWSGNSKNLTVFNRNIPLKKLVPLFELPFSFHSLQIEIEENEKKIFNQHKNFFNHKKEIIGFDNTAALINNLDLVITVDTSIAHLAGSLGKKVWIMLPFIPDFRWLLKIDWSPWYPSARLLRQTKFNDWDEIITLIQKDLKKV